MATDSVVDRILRRDWSVVQVAAGWSPEQHHALLPLLAHEAPEVRELLLNCLNAIGGTVARNGLVHALRDPDEVIRARACQFLHHHVAPEMLPALTSELEDNPDEYVREHAALLIGAIGDSTVIPVLKGCLRTEGIAYTRLALMLALARLGDPGSQAELVGRLHDDVPGRVAEALEDFLYVNDPRLVNAIRPSLQDLRDAVNVGMSHSPVYVRVCDVAVAVLDTIMNHPFSFAVTSSKRYSDAELSSVKTHLDDRIDAL